MPERSRATLLKIASPMEFNDRPNMGPGSGPPHGQGCRITRQLRICRSCRPGGGGFVATGGTMPRRWQGFSTTVGLIPAVECRLRATCASAALRLLTLAPVTQTCTLTLSRRNAFSAFAARPDRQSFAARIRPAVSAHARAAQQLPSWKAERRQGEKSPGNQPADRFNCRRSDSLPTRAGPPHVARASP